MAPKTRQQVRPAAADEAEVRTALEAVDRGELLSVEKSEAYVRWLETGEGPCPVNDDDFRG